MQCHLYPHQYRSEPGEMLLQSWSTPKHLRQSGQVRNFKLLCCVPAFGRHLWSRDPHCPSCILVSHLFSLELMVKGCMPLLPAHSLGMLLAVPKRTKHFTGGEWRHREIKA